MLRLPDARSGLYAQVRLSQPGLLRAFAHLLPGAGELDWVGVRVLLIADLLARAAELRGIQVVVATVFPGQPPAEHSFAERSAGLLGIHPAVARASSADAPAVLGGQADVHIVGPGSMDDQLRGLITRVGAIRVHTVPSGEGHFDAAGAIAAAGDSLAIRLVLMSRPLDHAVDLDDDVLARACEKAARWREQVANWAESPSRPMPQSIRTALKAAFGDLDVPRALELLTGLAEQIGVPDGVRFETFVFADRVLGLDLARQVGQSRR